MEKAILQYLPQTALHQRIHQFGFIQPVLCQCRSIRETKPIHPFHSQHLARGKVRVHFGHKDQIVDARVQFVESLRVARFRHVVNLAVNEFTKVIDNRLQINVAVEQFENAIVDAAPPAQHVQIQGDNLFARGALDFESHQVAVFAQNCLVDCG